MKRPDHTFTIHVCPTYDVFSCAVKRDEEKRGLFGFHSYTRCPDCRCVFRGWEFWGENGHMQGSAPTRDRLVHWLAHTVRKQWRASGDGDWQPKGSIIGYRFTRGRSQYYVGGNA